MNLRVSRCLKEELAWVIDKRLWVLSNKILFKRVVPLKNYFKFKQNTRCKLLPKNYKYGRNLVQRLVRTKLTGNTDTNINKYPSRNITTPTFPAKNVPCRQPPYGVCHQLTLRNNYYSFQTKHCYTIKQNFHATQQGLFIYWIA